MDLLHHILYCIRQLQNGQYTARCNKICNYANVRL